MSVAPYTAVAVSLAASRSTGTSTTARKPAAAAPAATALARFPVEAQPTVSRPNSFALLRATETRRSLNESVGWQAAAYLSQRSRMPRAAPRRGAASRGGGPGPPPAVGAPCQAADSPD